MNPTFRIFVSSTFADFKAERNALQEDVFPRLHRYCQQHGARFQVIDLRWGIAEEATHNHQTINICLNEIDRCRRSPLPNFVVLLGDRYGWRPPPAQIPETEWDQIVTSLGATSPEARLLKEWYCPDTNAVPPEHYLKPRVGIYLRNERWEPVAWELRDIVERMVSSVRRLEDSSRLKYEASATHQEIHRGALRVPEEHAFCYFRRIEVGGRPLADLPGAEDYFNLKGDGTRDAVADERLRRLKKELRGLRGIKLRDSYEASWTGAAGSPISVDHVDRFCTDVYEDLLGTIRRQLVPLVERDRLTREIEAHRDFGLERAEVFEGRDEELARIGEYLERPNGRPLVVSGEPGSGKSALIAQAAMGADAPDAKDVIVRFIGSTPDSSTGRGLLGDICRQLGKEWGLRQLASRPVSTELRAVATEFSERIRLAAKRRRLALFIDGLDQLSGADGARDLWWLPTELPENVAVVVSTTIGETLTRLESRLGDESPSVSVSPMRRHEGERALTRWLANATPPRTLADHQLRTVLDAFAVEGKPLSLRLAFEEARRWKGDLAGAAIGLPTTIAGIIDEKLFARLSSREHHGPKLVSHALGYLAAARNGLTEDELLEVLSRSDAVFDDFLEHSHPDHELPERRLPVVIWSRLFFDLEPYLTQRTADGTSLLVFYHRQLEERAKAKYLAGADRVGRHRELAGYFLDQGREIVGEERTAPNLRTLSELPFQQANGEMWDGVFNTLTDFDFLEKKAVHVAVTESTDEEGDPIETHAGMYELRQDFALALSRMPGGSGAPARPRIVVTAADFGDGLKLRCPHCTKVIDFRQEWRGSERECPPEEGGCGGPWRVNEFVLRRGTGQPVSRS